MEHPFDSGGKTPGLGGAKCMELGSESPMIREFLFEETWTARAELPYCYFEKLLVFGVPAVGIGPGSNPKLNPDSGEEAKNRVLRAK